MSLRKRYIGLSDIIKGKWLMDQRAAEGYFPTVLKMVQGDIIDLNQSGNDDKPKDGSILNGEFKVALQDSSSYISVYRISEFGEQAPPEKAPPDSVAILDIKDVITKYDQFCGGAGTVTKRELLNRAQANPNIKAIVLDIDSPGGDGTATELLMSAIKECSIPVIAFVEGCAASAAYWIASASDEIMVGGNTSELGSIGSYIQFTDFSKYYEDQGIKVIRVYAPQSTLKNKSYEDALKGDTTLLQQELKDHVDFFVNDVKANRPGLSKDKAIFQGALFYADESISNGLADSKGTLNDAISRAYYLSNQNSNTKNSKNNTMSLFGKDFPKLSAIKGKESKEITEAVLSEINAEIKGAGLETIEITSAGKVNALVDDLKTEKDNATALTTKVDTLTAQVTELTSAKKTVEEENATLHAKLAAIPGARHTNPYKTEDAIVVPETGAQAPKFEDFDHNKAALEDLKDLK